MKELVEAIKTFSKNQYSNGFDVIVECYNDQDLVEFCERNECKTLADFKRAYLPVIANRLKSSHTFILN